LSNNLKEHTGVDVRVSIELSRKKSVDVLG
jgi:hypothetical protein